MKFIKQILILTCWLGVSAVYPAQASEVVASSGAAGNAQVQASNQLSTVDIALEAQIVDLENFLAEVEACNDRGLIYGSGNSAADSAGCIAPEETDPGVLNFANELTEGMPLCEGEWDFLTSPDATTIQCASLPAPSYTYQWQAQPIGERCSLPCSGGTVEAVVWCERSDGVKFMSMPAYRGESGYRHVQPGDQDYVHYQQCTGSPTAALAGLGGTAGGYTLPCRQSDAATYGYTGIDGRPYQDTCHCPDSTTLSATGGSCSVSGLGADVIGAQRIATCHSGSGTLQATLTCSYQGGAASSLYAWSGTSTSTGPYSYGPCLGTCGTGTRTVSCNYDTCTGDASTTCPLRACTSGAWDYGSCQCPSGQQNRTTCRFDSCTGPLTLSCAGSCCPSGYIKSEYGSDICYNPSRTSAYGQTHCSSSQTLSPGGRCTHYVKMGSTAQFCRGGALRSNGSCGPAPQKCPSGWVESIRVSNLCYLPSSRTPLGDIRTSCSGGQSLSTDCRCVNYVTEYTHVPTVSHMSNASCVSTGTWTLGSWSSCTNGQQTRSYSCTGGNGRCSGSKPAAEKRSCAVAPPPQKCPSGWVESGSQGDLCYSPGSLSPRGDKRSSCSGGQSLTSGCRCVNYITEYSHSPVVRNSGGSSCRTTGSWTLGSWSSCTNGQQTRSYSCSGGNGRCSGSRPASQTRACLAPGCRTDRNCYDQELPGSRALR